MAKPSLCDVLNEGYQIVLTFPEQVHNLSLLDLKPLAERFYTLFEKEGHFENPNMQDWKNYWNIWVTTEIIRFLSNSIDLMKKYSNLQKEKDPNNDPIFSKKESE